MVQIQMTRLGVFGSMAVLLGALACSSDPETPLVSPNANVAGSAGAGSSGADSGDSTRLQADLQALADSECSENGILGMGISVRLKDGSTHEVSAGRSGPRASDAKYDVAKTRQVLGSVTKLFTAVLALQLVEEGAFTLDDTIDRWFEFPAAKRITVRMLLNHTSGLADCLTVLSAERQSQPLTPEQLISVAVEAPPLAAPGGKVAYYSNTNFVLLAKLVELASGERWETRLRTKIGKPLGLASLGYAGDGAGAANFVDGWVQEAGSWKTSRGRLDASAGWGAGAVVATNRDTAAFLHALFDNRLFVKSQTLTLMREFTVSIARDTLSEGEPDQDVGLALIRFHIGDGATLEGHLGHALGYQAAAVRDPETSALITVTANTDHAILGLTAVKIATYLREREAAAGSR